MYAVCNTYMRSVYRVTHIHSYYIHIDRYRLCLYLYVNFMYTHKVAMYNKKRYIVRFHAEVLKIVITTYINRGI